MSRGASDLAQLYRRHLQLMEEVRTYYIHSPKPRSNFVKGILTYFETHGRLTAKQERAIKGWLEKEKNKRVFVGKPPLEVKDTTGNGPSRRFQILMAKKAKPES